MDFSKLTDDQLDAFIANGIRNLQTQQAPRVSENVNIPFPKAPPEKPGFVSSNLKKGFATAGQAVGGALRFLGADEVGNTTAEYWKQRQQEYEAADPSMKLGDIGGVGDAAKYVGANVLQMAPVSIMSMVPGGVLGRGAALANMGANAIKGAAIAGGGLGALGTETGIITSEVDPNKELDRTQIMKGAIPAAAAEFGSELVGLGRTGIGSKLVKALGKEAVGESVEQGVKAAAKPLWQRAGKTAGDLATIAATEGMTESAQSPLEAWGAGKQVFKEGKSFGDAPLANTIGALSGGMLGGGNYTPEMQSEMLESFGAGAAGGLGMGGGGKLVNATIDMITKPKVMDDSTPTDLATGNSVDNDIADRINAERNNFPLQPDIQDSMFEGVSPLASKPVVGTAQDMTNTFGVTPSVDPIAEAGEQKLASISAGFKTATDITKAVTSLEKEIATAQDGLKSVARFPELAGNVPALEQQLQVAQYALGKLQAQYGTRLPEILKNVQQNGIVAGREFDPNSPVDSAYAGMAETINPDDPYSYTYTDQQGNPTEFSNEQMTLPFGEDTYGSREQLVREAQKQEPAYQTKKAEQEATEAEQTAAKITADTSNAVASLGETKIPETEVIPEQVVPNAAPEIAEMSQPTPEAVPAKKKRGFGGVPVPTTVAEAEAIAPKEEVKAESTILGKSEGYANKMLAGKERKKHLEKHPKAEIVEREGRFYVESKGKVTSAKPTYVKNSDKVISDVMNLVQKFTGNKISPALHSKFIERKDRAGNMRLLSGETAIERDEETQKAIGVIINLVENAEGIKEIARHEVIHALRNMGLFTPAEWKILEAKANKWVKDFNLKANYPNLTKEELLEEGIAHAFENPKVAQDSFLKRIKDFLESLWNLVRTGEFKTAEKVFKQVESGEIGNRPWDGTIHDDLSKPALRVVAFREQMNTLLNRLFENSPLGNTPTIDSKNKIESIGPSERIITYRAISELDYKDFLENFEKAYAQASINGVLKSLKEGSLSPVTSPEKGGKSSKSRAFAALTVYKNAFKSLVDEHKQDTPDTKLKTPISTGFKESKITTVGKLREYSEKLSKHADSAFDAASSGKFMRMLHHINELEAMGISSARGMYNREALIKGFTFYHFGEVSETMLPEYMLFIDPNVYRAKDLLATGYDRQVESYLGASIVNKDYKEESKQAIINSPIIQELYAQIAGDKPIAMINLGSSPEFRTPAGMYLVRTLHRLGVIKVHESIGLPLAKGANRKDVTALPQILTDERGTHKEIMEGVSEVSDEAGVVEISESAGGMDEDTADQSAAADRELARMAEVEREEHGFTDEKPYDDMGGIYSDEAADLERNRKADTKGQTEVVPVRTEGIDLTKPSKDTFVIILDPTKFGVSAKRNWRKTLKGKDLRAQFKAAMKEFEQNGDREALLKTYTSVLLSTWDRLQSIETDPKANKRYAKLTEQVNSSKLAKEELGELLSKVGVPVRGTALKTLFENLDVAWHRVDVEKGTKREQVVKEISKYLKNRNARNIDEAAKYIWKKLEDGTSFFGDSLGTPVAEGKEAIDYQRALNSFMAQHAIFGDDKFSEVYFINDDIRILKARNGEVQAPVGHSFALSYLARRAYLDAGNQRRYNKENSMSKAAQLAAIHASKYGVYPFTINDTYTIDAILTHLMSEETSAADKRKTKIVLDEAEQNRINKFVVEMMYQNNQANLKKLFGEAKESGKAPTKLLKDTGETEEYSRMPIPAVTKRVRDLINMMFNGDPAVSVPAENQLMRFLDRIEDGLIYSDFAVAKYQTFLQELDKDLRTKSTLETELIKEEAAASKMTGAAKSLVQGKIDDKRKKLRDIANPKKYMVALTKVLRESVTGGTMIDIPNKWKMAPTASFNITEYVPDWSKLSDAEKDDIKENLIPAIMKSLGRAWGFMDEKNENLKDLSYKVITNQDTGVTSIFFWQGSSVEHKAVATIRTMNKEIKASGSLTSRIKFGKALEDLDVITLEDKLLETLAEQGGVYTDKVSRTDDGRERLAVVPRAEAGPEVEYDTIDASDFREPERFPKFGAKTFDSGEETAKIEAELVKNINALFSKTEISEDELLARKVLKELYNQLGMEDKLYGYDEIDTFDVNGQPIKKKVSIDMTRSSRPNDFNRNLGDAMYNLPWEEQRQFMTEERRAALVADRDYDARIERAAARTISAVDNFIHGYTLDKATNMYKQGDNGIIGRQQGLGAFKLYRDKAGKLYSATLSDRKIKGQYMVKYKEYGKVNAAEILVTREDFERRFTPYSMDEKAISNSFDATGKIGSVTLGQEADNYMNAIAVVKDEKLQDALDSFFINPLEDDKTSISTMIENFVKDVTNEISGETDAKAKVIWNTRFGTLVKSLATMPFDAEALAVRWTKFDIISKAMEKASEEAQNEFVNAAIAKMNKTIAGTDTKERLKEKAEARIKQQWANPTIVGEIENVLQKLEDAGFITSSTPTNMESNKYYDRLAQIDKLFANEEQMSEERIKTLLAERDRLTTRYKESTKGGRTSYIGRKYMITPKFAKMLVTSASYNLDEAPVTTKAKYADMMYSNLSPFMNADGTPKAKNEMIKNAKKILSGVKENKIWLMIKNIFRVPYFQAERLFKEFGSEAALNMLRESNLVKYVQETWKSETSKVYKKFKTDFAKNLSEADFAKVNKFINWLDAFQKIPTANEAMAKFGITKQQYDMVIQFGKDNQKHFVEFMRYAGANSYLIKFETLFKIPGLVNKINDSIGSKMGTLTDKEARELGRSITPAEITDKDWQRKFRASIQGYNDFMKTTKANMGSTVFYMPRIRKIGKYVVVGKDAAGVKIAHAYFDDVASAEAYKAKLIAKDQSIFEYKTPPVGKITALVEPTPDNQYGLFSTMDSAQEYHHMMEAFDAEDAYKFQTPWFGNSALESGNFGSAHIFKRRNEDLILGYNTDNFMDNYEQGLGRIAMSFARMDYGQKQLAHLAQMKMDAKAKPALLPYLDEFKDHLIHDLKRPNAAERTGGEIKRLTAFYYMGWSFLGGLVNATQPFVVGAPELARIYGGDDYTKNMGRALKDIYKWTGFAAKDYMKFVREQKGKDAMWFEKAIAESFKGMGINNIETLPETHADALHKYSKSGLLNSMVNDLTFKNSLDDNFASEGHINKFMEQSLNIFGVTEVINREGSFLAAFDHYYKQTGNTDEAYKMAEQFVSGTQYIVNKFNMPLSFKNLPSGVGTAMYALMSYPFNMLNQMYKHAYGIAVNKDMDSAKVIIGIMVMTFMLGGFNGLPFKDLTSLLWKLLGHRAIKGATGNLDVDMKRMLNNVAPEETHRLLLGGIPTLAGVNISKNIGMQTPFVSMLTGDKTAAEAVSGASGGLVKRGYDAINAIPDLNYQKFGENALPEFAARFFRADRMYTEGQLSPAGKSRTMGGKPIKETGAEALAAALVGVKSDRWAEIQEDRGGERDLKDKLKRMKDAAQKAAILDHDYKPMQQYNQYITTKGLLGIASPIKRIDMTPDKNLTKFQMAERNRKMDLGV